MTTTTIKATQTDKFIVRDCHGWALSFTGTGRSMQVRDDCADKFDTMVEAQDAIKSSSERGAAIFVLETR